MTDVQVPLFVDANSTVVDDSISKKRPGSLMASLLDKHPAKRFKVSPAENVDMSPELKMYKFVRRSRYDDEAVFEKEEKLQKERMEEILDKLHDVDHEKHYNAVLALFHGKSNDFVECDALEVNELPTTSLALIQEGLQLQDDTMCIVDSFADLVRSYEPKSRKIRHRDFRTDMFGDLLQEYKIDYRHPETLERMLRVLWFENEFISDVITEPGAVIDEKVIQARRQFNIFMDIIIGQLDVTALLIESRRSMRIKKRVIKRSTSASILYAPFKEYLHNLRDIYKDRQDAQQCYFADHIVLWVLNHYGNFVAKQNHVTGTTVDMLDLLLNNQPKCKHVLHPVHRCNILPALQTNPMFNMTTADDAYMKQHLVQSDAPSDEDATQVNLLSRWFAEATAVKEYIFE